MKIGNKVVYHTEGMDFVGVVVAKTQRGHSLVKFCEPSNFMHSARSTPSYLQDGSMYTSDNTMSYYFVSDQCKVRVIGEI